MDCASPPPPPSGSTLGSPMPKDRILNMSQRPYHHLNPSSAELVKEITNLEVEIVRLERYLLSRYRTAFQPFLPNNPGNHGIHVQQLTGICPSVTSDQPQRMKLEMLRDYEDRVQSSPTSALAVLNDQFEVATPNSSSGREKKSDYFQQHSLADHLGNSRMGNAINCPDRLSEKIIRCISSIYCKLGRPTRSHKGYSVSSASSFCSSSTFSPRNLSGSWSPQCNDEVTEHCDSEGSKRDDGVFMEMVEVLKICLDDESYSYAEAMLQKFRSLVKSLEIVDLKMLKREQKLAFWINIHNALVMHAYLAYGTKNYIKSTSIMKASYNVGGHCINAYDIQSYILGIKSHYSATWLQTLLSPEKKFKTGTTKHAYSVEYPEPLVHFALCSGSYTDPAVRVYNAKSIFLDLNIAKEEFIQATVYVHKQTKIYLPRILHYYGKDMSLGLASLLEAVSECLPVIRQKQIRKIFKGQPEKYVHWAEQSSSFRYLIHNETSGMR